MFRAAVVLLLHGCSCGDEGTALLDAATGPNDAAADAEPGRDAGETDSGDDAALPGAPLSTLVCELEERPGPIPEPPETRVADFGPPIRLALDDPCPQDAVEVSPDGTRVYYWYMINDFQLLLDEGRIVEGTEVRFHDLDGGEWGPARLLDLRRGDSGALPGETSVAPDGSWVVWHAQSPQNFGEVDGYPEGQSFDLDIFEAAMANSVPEPGTHLGREVNSRYLEGEQWVTDDGRTLYFASNRPGGLGDLDIWKIQRDAQGVWAEAEALGEPVSSAASEIQPTFSPDGRFIYFTSTRGGRREIWRVATTEDGGFEGEAELVLSPHVGEATFTGDGRLFFVHVELEGGVPYDVDIYFVEPE
ncbi:MAG: PD40 domain-containing protein [Deltaproteobacteria bacterium]|nr:PD40 domain-containing protein [Deltaproteobacteria bacterium]